MAGESYDIGIKSEATARAWVNKADNLNEQLNEVNKRVEMVIRDIEGNSAGDFVVELVTAANNALKFGTEIFNTVGTIAKTVNSVIDNALDIAAKLLKTFAGLNG